MISFLNSFTNNFALIINFLAHFTIFIGAFYVAIHNRSLPQWHVTPLWYTGLCSLLVSITIMIQWTIGPEYPLSYWNAGVMCETLLHVSIAAIAAVMFTRTVLIDLRYRKKRGTIAR